MHTVSVGIAAYNEERNIRRCIEAILGQQPGDYELVELIVISSGSTDGTNDIVESIAEIDPRVKLLKQDRREGKASALNLFMKNASGDILVQVNADAVISPDAISKLIKPFDDPNVGAVAGHVVPVNDTKDFFGFAVNLVYNLHHAVSSVSPKACEFVAYRNLHMEMPNYVNTDEDWLANSVLSHGYKLAYGSDAIVHVRGPSNLYDFLNQRIRINIGENYMKRRFDYLPPTKNTALVFNSLLIVIREERPNPLKLMSAIMLEAISRGYAKLYVMLGFKDHNMWKMIESTKEV